MRSSRRNLLLRFVPAALMTAMLLAGGCKAFKWSTKREPTRPQLQLTHLVGGTHEHLVMHNGVWYQAFASRLLVIDPANGELLANLELGPAGTIGPVTDLARRGDRLYAIVEDDEVVEISLDNPLLPRIVRSATADELEVRPRRLSVVDGELYVSGGGGVVRWSDGWVYLPGLEDVSVVTSAGGERLACSGRRAYRLEDGSFVGSASELYELPASYGGDGAFVFVRRAGSDALVGQMTEDVQEVNPEVGTVAVRGPVRRVRLFEDQIWVVTDHAIEVFGTAADRLVRRRRIDVLGARDVGPINENYLAVAGSFGRALYRMETDSGGPGDTFLQAHREPSRLERAHRRGAMIAAGSAEGVWLYTIGADAELSELAETNLPDTPPSLEASTVRLSARVSPDHRLVSLSGPRGEYVYAESDLALIRCVASIDDEIWVGHDRGLSVLGFNDDGGVHAVHQLRLPGAVERIYPLITGGGAAFVSPFGGFGVAEIIRVPIPPEELELMTEEEIEAARIW